MNSIKGKSPFLLLGMMALLYLTSVEGQSGGGVLEADSGTIEYNAKDAMGRSAKGMAGDCSCVYHIKTISGEALTVTMEKIPEGSLVSTYPEADTTSSVTQATTYDSTNSGQTVEFPADSMTFRITQGCTEDNAVKMQWKTNNNPIPPRESEAFGFVESQTGEATWSGKAGVDRGCTYILPYTSSRKMVTVELVHLGPEHNWWEETDCQHHVSMGQLHPTALRTVCKLDCRNSSYTTIMEDGIPMKVWGENRAATSGHTPSIMKISWTEIA